MPRTKSLRFARRAGLAVALMSFLVLATGKAGEAGSLGVAGLVVFSLALLGLGRGERLLTRTMAALTGIVAAIAVVISLLPGGQFLEVRVPPVMTIILVASAVAAIAAAFGTRRVSHVALGVSGLTLLSIGLTCLFVRAVGLFDLFGGRAFSEIPFALSLAGVVLGLICIGLVWWDTPDPTEYPSSALVAVTIAGLVSSILLWRTLAVHEELQIERMTAQESEVATRIVEKTIDAVGRTMKQFVRLTDTLSDAERHVHLMYMLPDLPSAEFLGLVDSAGVPYDMFPDDRGIALASEALRTQPFPKPLGALPIARHLQVPGDSNRLLLHVPRCDFQSCRGGVMAVLRSDLILDRAMGDRFGWRYRLGAAPREVAHDYEVVLPLALTGVNWQLATRPSGATMAATRTSVPEVVLILGIIMTALLTGTVRLGATAWQGARTIERMRVSTAISRATDAVWEWDVVSGNLARSGDLWHYLGYERGQRDLKEWMALVHPEDRAAVSEAFHGLSMNGRDAFEVEYRIVTAHGDWHIVVDRGRVIDRDIDGTVRRVMGITADVTLNRRAAQELREVEALSGMGRVAARMAHEINNPLAGIRSAFTLIKDAVPTDHPHYHYVGAIEREVERIGNVTRHLYEVYRPDDVKTGASLITICNDAVALLAQVNRAANVEFDLDLADVPQVVPVSGGLLRQIVYNLVQNAVDASPFGGTVDIVGRVERNQLVLSVLDQGPGVPVELRERVFEPFFTTKDATVRTSGMGLGLTMVARSVAAAGGTVEIGDVPGGGARFTVRVPLGTGGSNHAAAGPHTDR